MMYLIFTMLTLATGSIYLYRCDKGDLFMKFVWLYEFMRTYLVQPIHLRLYPQKDITQIYKNNIPCRVSDLSTCIDGDIVEIQWRSRYRTVYNGSHVSIEMPFERCNEQQNILCANLYKYIEGGVYETIDVTDVLEQYSGPNGDFFETDSLVYNKPRYFYRVVDGKRCRLLDNKNDYISLLDKNGTEIELRL